MESAQNNSHRTVILSRSETKEKNPERHRTTKTARTFQPQNPKLTIVFPTLTLSNAKGSG
jgi:hypothetical protein